MTSKTSFIIAATTVLFAAFLAKLQAALDKRAPMGYQDENGFHFGPEPVRESADVRRSA